MEVSEFIAVTKMEVSDLCNVANTGILEYSAMTEFEWYGTVLRNFHYWIYILSQNGKLPQQVVLPEL